jgi:hypothetical protein
MVKIATCSDILSRCSSHIEYMYVCLYAFRRAKETAKIIHQHFQAKSPLHLEHSLRERNFGELNLTETSNYQKVWVHDARDPNHTVFGCESVVSVFSRTSALVAIKIFWIMSLSATSSSQIGMKTAIRIYPEDVLELHTSFWIWWCPRT